MKYAQCVPIVLSVVACMGCSERDLAGPSPLGATAELDHASRVIHVSINKRVNRGLFLSQIWHYDVYFSDNHKLWLLNPEVTGPDTGQDGFGYLTFDKKNKVLGVCIYKLNYDFNADGSATGMAIAGHSPSQVSGTYSCESLWDMLK